MQRIDLNAAARRSPSCRFFSSSRASSVPCRRWRQTQRSRKKLSLQKKAIEEDNLNVNRRWRRKEELQTAITKCDGDKCTLLDQGVSVSRPRRHADPQPGALTKARRASSQAIGMDSSIDLDPAYKNPQLDAIWSDVKKHGGSPAGGKPAKIGPQPTGDFTHTPVTEARVRTPLPIYVEYGGDEELSRVSAKYKAFGMTEWKTLDLKKLDNGFRRDDPVQGRLAGRHEILHSGIQRTERSGRQVGCAQQAV